MRPDRPASTVTDVKSIPDQTRGDGNNHNSSGGGGGGGNKDDDDQGWFDKMVDDVTDWVEGAAEDVVEFLDDAGDAVSDAVEDAWDAVEDAWNSTVGPVVDEVLETLEEAGIFDLIDDVTLGVIDIEYDGENLSVELGIEGVAEIGIEIGSDGLFVDVDTLVGGANVGIGSDGSLDVGIEVGIEGIAAVEGSVGVDGDGNVSFEYDVEVHIPDPSGGTIDLEASAGFEEFDDGFLVEGSATVGYTTVGGQTVGIGVHGSHEQHGDESTTTIGVHGHGGQKGIAEGYFSLDHTTDRDGDDKDSETNLTTGIDSIFGDTEHTTTLSESDDDKGDRRNDDNDDNDNQNTGTRPDNQNTGTRPDNDDKDDDMGDNDNQNTGTRPDNQNTGTRPSGGGDDTGEVTGTVGFGTELDVDVTHTPRFNRVPDQHRAGDVADDIDAFTPRDRPDTPRRPGGIDNTPRDRERAADVELNPTRLGPDDVAPPTVEADLGRRGPVADADDRTPGHQSPPRRGGRDGDGDDASASSDDGLDVFDGGGKPNANYTKVEWTYAVGEPEPDAPTGRAEELALDRIVGDTFDKVTAVVAEEYTTGRPDLDEHSPDSKAEDFAMDPTPLNKVSTSRDTPEVMAAAAQDDGLPLVNNENIPDFQDPAAAGDGYIADDDWEAPVV